MTVPPGASACRSGVSKQARYVLSVRKVFNMTFVGGVQARDATRVEVSRDLSCPQSVPCIRTSQSSYDDVNSPSRSELIGDVPVPAAGKKVTNLAALQ